MQIIPVIDLKNGQVVHAKQGQRTHYMPIQSCLSTSSEAHDIVGGLLKLYPFRTIYIADIDAIQGAGSNAPIIAALCQRYPHIHWWVDCGRNISDTTLNLCMVIGSESIPDMREYLDLHEKLHGDFVLSLDYLNDKPLGAEELHRTANYWPNKVICMTLNAVGGNQGADLVRIKSLQQLSPSSAIFAAGGVRNVKDLRLLQTHGITGVLVATALHNGIISAQDIAQFR